MFGHLCQFSSIMLAIWRYFDMSYCLPVLLSNILRSMHLQQYACLVFVVDHTRCMVFDYGKYIEQYCIYSIVHYYLYYVATFTTVSIVSKRLITPVIIMLPPCSSSLVSSSHSCDETITKRHPRNDALALLSPPSVVLQKGDRGNAVAKARCLSLVYASAENREHSLHEGGGRLNQGDVSRYTISVR